jgi:Autotransporter beta-domain
MGYTKQKMNEHDNAMQDFTSDNYHIGTYFYNQGIDEKLVLTGLLGYSYSQHHSSRYAELGGYSGTQVADFNGNSIYSAFEVSYNIGHFGTVTLMPNAGLQYAFVSQDKVEESGNDLRLNVDKDSTNMLVSFIGIDALFDSFEKADYLSPMMFFRYEHDWQAKREDSHKMDAALAIQPDFKETFIGQNRGAENFVYGAGLKANGSDNLEFNVGLFGSRSEDGHEVSVLADMIYRF